MRKRGAAGRQKPMDRLSMSVRDFVWLCGLVGSIIFSYATLTTRTNYTDTRISDLEQRYAREVVPRNEHLEMNRRLDDRLAKIEAQLSELLSRRASN